MPTALIADDEPLLRAELRDTLAECWPELEIVCEAADGLTALQEINKRDVDVAFLDIKMPRMSGLEAAEQIEGKTHIVFVTAFDDHAIAAFDKGAVDYVMKPIRLARLAKTVERVKHQLHLDPTSANENTRTLAAALNREAEQWLKHIQVSTGKQVRFIMADEIVYIQSDNKYTRVVTAKSDAFIRKPLIELSEALDPNFFWRIHRNTLVNIRAIDAVIRVDGERMQIKLKERPDVLEVSRPHQAQFRGL